MPGASLIEQSLVIGLTACGEWITDFDQPFLWEEYHAWTQTAMADTLLLEMTQPQDTTGKNRPQLSFSKIVLSQVSLINLIVQSPLWIFV